MAETLDAKRAAAWKKVALDTRQVVGRMMDYLADCCNLLEDEAAKVGTLRMDVDCAAMKALAEQCTAAVDAVNVPTPGIIMREFRQIERNE